MFRFGRTFDGAPFVLVVLLPEEIGYFGPFGVSESEAARQCRLAFIAVRSVAKLARPMDAETLECLLFVGMCSISSPAPLPVEIWEHRSCSCCERSRDAFDIDRASAL
jgi:hypothetical protein